MKTLIVAAALAAMSATAASANYVETGRLGWGDSFRIYLHYFPRSIGT